MPSSIPPAAMPSSTKPSIPPDVCQEIATHIHDKGKSPIFSRPAAKKALIALSEVSWACAFASRRIQYEQVLLGTSGRLASFLNLVKGSNNVKIYIREIVVGGGLESRYVMNLSVWTSKFLDIRVFESLLPNLRSMRINNMPRHYTEQHEHSEVFRSFDNITLPNQYRLSALTVRAKFFRDIQQANSLLCHMACITQLQILDVSPTFVHELHAILPATVKSLRLDEYPLWDWEVFRQKSPNVSRPRPSTRTTSLERFYYRNLSGRAAYILEPLLLELSSGAYVKIEIEPKPYDSFDASKFKASIKTVARVGVVLGVEEYIVASTNGFKSPRQRLRSHFHWALLS